MKRLISKPIYYCSPYVTHKTVLRWTTYTHSWFMWLVPYSMYPVCVCMYAFSEQTKHREKWIENCAMLICKFSDFYTMTQVKISRKNRMQKCIYVYKLYILNCIACYIQRIGRIGAFLNYSKRKKKTSRRRRCRLFCDIVIFGVITKFSWMLTVLSNK